MLTEKETWLKMEKAFKEHDYEGLGNCGICSAANHLCYYGEISPPIRKAINDKAMAEVNRIGEIGYIAQTRCPEGDAIRAKFCREQAALLEKDGE